jgi:hypothetical protein
VTPSSPATPGRPVALDRELAHEEMGDAKGPVNVRVQVEEHPLADPVLGRAVDALEIVRGDAAQLLDHDPAPREPALEDALHVDADVGVNRSAVILALRGHHASLDDGRRGVREIAVVDHDGRRRGRRSREQCRESEKARDGEQAQGGHT